jgi:hypothetical protein
LASYCVGMAAVSTRSLIERRVYEMGSGRSELRI